MGRSARHSWMRISRGDKRRDKRECSGGCLDVEFEADLDDKNAEVIEVAV